MGGIERRYIKLSLSKLSKVIKETDRQAWVVARRGVVAKGFESEERREITRDREKREKGLEWFNKR